MKQMDNDGNYIDMREGGSAPPPPPTPPPVDNSNGPSPYGYHDPRRPRRRRPWVILPILAFIAIIGCLGLGIMSLVVFDLSPTTSVVSATTEVAAEVVYSEYSYEYGSDTVGNWSYPLAGINGISINSINIDIVSPNVVFTEGSGSNITLSVYSYDDEKSPSFKMEVLGDALNFTEEEDSVFNYGDYDCTLVVELPAYSLNSLDISNVAGDIEVTSAITADELNVECISGYVQLYDINCDNLTVCTTSGDITLYETYTDNLQLETVSGSIYAYSDLYAQNCDVITTSGDFYGASLYVSELKMNTVSGNFDVCSGLQYTLDYSTVSGTIDDWSSTVNGEADFSFDSVSGNLTAQLQ